MLGWPIDETSAPSTARQKSNNQRQHRLEKSERGFAWNQGLVMILADREENGPCSEKSVCSWTVNSIQPSVEAPERWWGCMSSWVGQGDRSILAHSLVALAHTSVLALDWDLHRDKQVLCPLHPALYGAWHIVGSSVNVWQINTWIKIIGTIYWTLTIHFKLVAPFNLHSNLIIRYHYRFHR